jgi:hypothetical protein
LQRFTAAPEAAERRKSVGPEPDDEKAAARRARVDELRRAEQARERRKKVAAITVSVVVLAAVVFGGYRLFTAGEEPRKLRTDLIPSEQTWGKLGRDHVTKDVDYAMTPPAGGDHDPVWANCNGDVYTKEIREENVVHSLEHGAVWVTYNDQATDADVKALADRVSKTPYTLMSPYKDQPSPITLTAWGHQLKVDKASDARVAQFFTRYVQGKQTPEPGAPCTGGSMG